jgi:hypothetical protein
MEGTETLPVHCASTWKELKQCQDSVLAQRRKGNVAGAVCRHREGTETLPGQCAGTGQELKYYQGSVPAQGRN